MYLLNANNIQNGTLILVTNKNHPHFHKTGVVFNNNKRGNYTIKHANGLQFFVRVDDFQIISDKRNISK